MATIITPIAKLNDLELRNLIKFMMMIMHQSTSCIHITTFREVVIILSVFVTQTTSKWFGFFYYQQL